MRALHLAVGVNLVFSVKAQQPVTSGSTSSAGIVPGHCSLASAGVSAVRQEELRHGWDNS